MPKEKEKIEGAEEELITVSKSDLSEMKARLAALETATNSPTKRPKRVKEHTAKIALFNGIPVVGWDYVKGTEDLVINLHLLDGTKVQQDYLKFLNKADRITVKILNQEARKFSVVDTRDGGGGIMPSVNPDEANIAGAHGHRYGYDIELEVTRVEYESEVEIIEGDLVGTKLKISNNYLNI